MSSNNTIPTNPFNDQYSSLTRPIKVFLPEQKNKNNGEEDHFVGRERLKERLFNWLSDENKNSVSYLVTGFRGMGKTSLVNRVTDRLTREINPRQELWWMLLIMIPVLVFGIVFGLVHFIAKENIFFGIAGVVLLVWFTVVLLISRFDRTCFKRWKRKKRKAYSNHHLFNNLHVDKMAQGKKEDLEAKSYHNIKVSINLGHEVLRERDVLGLIATNVKDKYKVFVNSVKPHLVQKSMFVVLVCLLSYGSLIIVQNTLTVENLKTYNTTISIDKKGLNNQQVITLTNPDYSENQQIIVTGELSDSWFSRLSYNVASTIWNAYKNDTALGFLTRFLLFVLLTGIWGWLSVKLSRFIPFLSAPICALRRLDTLVDRIVATTDEESGMNPSVDKNIFTISLFNRRKHTTKPIADIREIETELADIINLINAKACPQNYRANFIVVFDEMDKIDPAMMRQSQDNEMPEFKDSVKGFPDGMDSRERRRNVLKLLANIKLFVSTAKAKFVFISGRELYDAYLADLSDRDFAISSIFSGVINVDSFLTPEGGQTDVRSMSEWYITNRLIPQDWLEKTERKNAEGQHGQNEKKNDWAVLKQEKPSLRWYYEYLIEVINQSGLPEDEKKKKYQDANYVIGFLHIFAAYLTHISNGSPKKIFLYFDKYLRCAKDCMPMNDWNDICVVGRDLSCMDQSVLFFEPIQQRTINFVFYLSNPIMGTITNDKSKYGDRFLVSLSFIIDHIYKYHNRSFSWRNIEQIPDLLKTSKAPELRDEMTSIMEYLTQIHISPILIGLNEYKFHKSIAEEISVISRISDEASAIFNFTLDESLSVIQYNTRLLNYYIGLDKESRDRNNTNSKSLYGPIIARIHSNLGDLHYWDEDYYSSTMEYRAAIETLPDNKDDESGFLTRVRCMLKLGLVYEQRKLYPNAYQTYCRLINLLIKKRWVDENDFGLSVIDARTDGWQDKRNVMVYPKDSFMYALPPSTKEQIFNHQFNRPIFEGDYNRTEDINTSFSLNFDGIISAYAHDLTVEKSQTINTLTLFEEIRYLYQSILAKLSILEKMGMSGITQTNIDVAEGEFRTIHKSVNFREKFIVAADFFRKLAEILYYKNSLTILSQNQDSFYVSVYYDDHDLLANLDDFCLHSDYCENALTAKHDIQYFFYQLNNSATQKEPRFSYPSSSNDWYSMRELYQHLKNCLDEYIPDQKDDDNAVATKERIQKNVEAYLNYNIDTVASNRLDTFYFGTVKACECHCQELRKRGLRAPCYACKYYTRSIRILADNMFIGKLDVLSNSLTKSFGILKHSFKNKLLYTNSTNLWALAQTLEGFGNVMYACASGDNCEGDGYRPSRGITSGVINMLQELCDMTTEDNELRVMEKYENDLVQHSPQLSRLDKSILYYWDAYRFYLVDASYNEAVGCLNKILNIFVYYIEVLCYYGGESNVLRWTKDSDTVAALIGDREFDHSFIATLFQLIVRYTSYKYDFTNLNEINELKWIYSKEMRDNIDLTRLSQYPAIRSAWLRAVEIRAKGLHFLAKNRCLGYEQIDYLEFIKLTYPLITPQRRYETTFYEEVMGYYTKMRFNDHILNNLMDGHPMVDKNMGDYSNPYHISFYEKLYNYLTSSVDKERLDYILFEIGKKSKERSELIKKRLELLEFLIHDTLVCITNMVNVFTPHNHLSSYSKSFVGLIYNYYWEWSRKYEFLSSLYQYQELQAHDRTAEAEKIIDNIWGSGSIQSARIDDDQREYLKRKVKQCSELIPKDDEDGDSKFGSRSDRLYERLSHDIDNITINTIYSNYTAEMALKYYQMAEDINTEGEAYREMIESLNFLNDDLNNDTCQFNIASDRFLLNCGVLAEQYRRLDKLYRNSNVYNLRKAYIDGPDKLNKETVGDHQFDRSQFINSEY